MRENWNILHQGMKSMQMQIAIRVLWTQFLEAMYNLWNAFWKPCISMASRFSIYSRIKDISNAIQDICKYLKISAINWRYLQIIEDISNSFQISWIQFKISWIQFKISSILFKISTNFSFIRISRIQLKISWIEFKISWIELKLSWSVLKISSRL